MHRERITSEAEGQVFGIDTMSIREIRAWTLTSRLPHVPHYVAGVIKLRGAVLPVVDLAARLGWRPTEPAQRYAIIVTQIGGWIGDAVSDIVTIAEDTLQPPPATGQDPLNAFINGLAAIDGRMVTVLNFATLAAGEISAEAARREPTDVDAIAQRLCERRKSAGFSNRSRGHPQRIVRRDRAARRAASPQGAADCSGLEPDPTTRSKSKRRSRSPRLRRFFIRYAAGCAR